VPAEALRGGIKPYSLTDHIHEREAGYQLSKLVPSDAPLSGDFKLAFAPHVAPWFQGIISTVSVPLSKEMRASDIRQLFEERYGDEQLVKVQSEVPEIYQIAGKHGVRLGGFQVHSSGKRVVVVVRPALSPSSFSAPVSRRADSLSTSVHPLARRASSTTSSRAPRPSACRTSTSRSALASSTASRSTSERAQLDVRRRSTRLGQDDVRQWQEAGRVVAEQGGTARRQSPRRRPGWRRRTSHSSLSLSLSAAIHVVILSLVPRPRVRASSREERGRRPLPRQSRFSARSTAPCQLVSDPRAKTKGLLQRASCTGSSTTWPVVSGPLARSPAGGSHLPPRRPPSPAEDQVVLRADPEHRLRCLRCVPRPPCGARAPAHHLPTPRSSAFSLDTRSPPLACCAAQQPFAMRSSTNGASAARRVGRLGEGARRGWAGCCRSPCSLGISFRAASFSPLGALRGTCARGGAAQGDHASSSAALVQGGSSRLRWL